MTVKELLDRLERLFQKPESWTQHTFAATANGNHTGPQTDYAVCWCISGGVRKFDSDIYNPHSTFTGVTMLLERAAEARGFADEVQFNDDPATTHADVIELIREAKELLQAEQVPA